MLGFVIFGWPVKEKVLGTASPGFCDRCQNQSRWAYGKTRRWISLFFIPLIPLGRADHYLACEICGAAVELDAEEATEVIDMVEVTEAYTAGRLSDDEYVNEVQRFDARLRGHDPDETLGIEAGEGQHEDARYIQ